MKYKLTPLNTVCAILTVYDIYLFITAESSNLIIARAYLIPIILVGLIIDYLFQIFLKKKSWLFVIEIVFIISVVVINQLP
jgi:hypothetical protein